MSFHLKGFDKVQDSTLNNEIQDNMVEFFDWALLKKGNYFNVTVGETAPNGYDYSKLRLSSDERFTTGTCWEGVRGNWVWQCTKVVAVYSCVCAHTSQAGSLLHGQAQDRAPW